MPSSVDLFAVAAGGAFGALARYGVGSLEAFSGGKYLATMTANLTGCLVIGVVCALLQHCGASRGWYLFAVTGVLGGYTTFSAFSLDAVTMLQEHLYGRTLFYVGTSCVGGLAACALGLFVTGRMLKVVSHGCV